MNGKGKYLFVFLLCLPLSAMADFWLNQNQKGEKALEEGRPQEAARLFERPDWQGVAEYRAGQYAEAFERWAEEKTAEGYFNQGNAQAKKGDYPKAIAAYEKALALEADMADAQFNKELLEKLLQQNNDQQQQDQQKDSQDQQKDQNDQQDDQDQSQNNDQSQQEQSEQDRPQNDKDNDQDNNGDQDQEQKDQQQEQQEDSEDQQDKDQRDKGQKDDQPNDDQDNDQTGNPKNQESQQDQNAEQSPPVDQEVSEENQATEQWLRQIPDDPGGLLRRKFQRDYQLRLQGRK